MSAAVALSTHADRTATLAVVAIFALSVVGAAWAIRVHRPARRAGIESELAEFDRWAQQMRETPQPSPDGPPAPLATTLAEAARQFDDGYRRGAEIALRLRLGLPAEHPLEDDLAISLAISEATPGTWSAPRGGWSGDVVTDLDRARRLISDGGVDGP